MWHLTSLKTIWMKFWPHSNKDLSHIFFLKFLSLNHFPIIFSGFRVSSELPERFSSTSSGLRFRTFTSGLFLFCFFYKILSLLFIWSFIFRKMVDFLVCVAADRHQVAAGLLWRGQRAVPPAETTTPAGEKPRLNLLGRRLEIAVCPDNRALKPKVTEWLIFSVA